MKISRRNDASVVFFFRYLRNFVIDSSKLASRQEQLRAHFHVLRYLRIRFLIFSAAFAGGNLVEEQEGGREGSVSKSVVSHVAINFLPERGGDLREMI